MAHFRHNGRIILDVNRRGHPALPGPKRLSARYGLSIFCVFLAWAGRSALNQRIGEHPGPFIFFFPAAAIAAWFGGLGPGVFAIVLGAAAADWFFIQPSHSSSLSLGNLTSLTAFVISSLCIVAAIEGLHRSRRRAVALENEARRQETLLATTLASIGDAVIVTDQTGNVTFLNAEAERLTGWRKSEVNGKSLSEVFQIVNEQTRQPVENPVEKVFHAGKVVGLANHTVLITKDRTEIPIDDSAAPIRDADGPLFGVVLIFRDVAVQRHRERLLSEQARLLDLSADAIFARDTQNRITYWNNGAEETYGYTREEALGKTTHELLQTEFPERLEDIHRKIQEDGRWQGELIHTRKDGSRIVVISRWSTDCDPRGNPLSILQTNTDITERKRAEDALRESVKRADADLQAIARLHQIGTACVRSGTDFQACLQDILDAAISLTCAEKGHIQLVDGTGTLHIVAHRGFGQQYLNNFSAVRAGDESALGAVMHSHDRVIVEDVTQNQLFSGQPLLDLLLKERVRGVQSTPLTGSDGKILGMVSTHFAQPHWPTERELRLMDLLARQAADYIERKRTEEALHESQNRLSDELGRMTRLHALSVQIAQSDDIHLILQQILAASANFTGTEKGNIQLLDLETGRLRIVVHQGLGQRLIERFAEDGWAPTCGAALCKAERVIIEDVANDPSIQGREDLAIVLHDGIRAIQSTPLVTRDGRVLGMLNNHFREVHRPSEVDLRYLDMLARVAADLIERGQITQSLRESEERFRNLVEHAPFGVYIVDSNFRIAMMNAGSRTGAFRNVDPVIGRDFADAVRILWPEAVAAEVIRIFRHTLDTGERYYSRDFVHTRADLAQTEGYEWVLHRLSLSDGRYGVICYYYDSTELRRTEAALRESEARLEATVAERTAKLTETVNDLQSFSYSIAHDMRAPLRAMGSFAQLLMNEILNAKVSSEAKTYCERIAIGASRLDNLVNDALNYTKAALQDLRLQRVDLQKLVHGLTATYPNLYHDSADIQIEENLPVLIANESMLTQCFSNLLGNAVKFVAPGVRPKVRVWSEANNGLSRIWVEDNGIGIPKHSQPRLFTMFQKLENGYEGTGIGLAIVRKAVERMGGKVGVESEPNRGSRFWVELRTAPGQEPYE